MFKFLTPIILFAATLGLFFGFLSPQYQALLAKSSDLAQKNSALTNSRMIGDVREALRQKYNAISPDDAAKLKKMLPDAVDNVRLILDLDSMASTHGMGIRNVKVGSGGSGTQASGSSGTAAPAQDGNAWGSMQLSFSVSGTYPNFIAFLRDIETSLRIVDVTSLGVSTAAGKSGYYDYDITLRTYWLR